MEHHASGKGNQQLKLGLIYGGKILGGEMVKNNV